MGDEIDDFVDAMYHSILGRPADEDGRKCYAQQIREGILKKGELDGILRASSEYDEGIGIIRANKEVGEFVRAKYREVLHRPADTGGLAHYVREIFDGRIKQEDLVSIFKQSGEYTPESHSVRLAYGTICKYLGEALENAKRVREYVDEIVIIYQFAEVDKNILDAFKALDARLYLTEWTDDFSYYRTQYLEHARELNCDWVFTTDTDEYPDHALCENVRRFIQESGDGARYNSIAFNSHDVALDENGREIAMNVSNYWKQMLFMLYPGVHYERRVHHDLIGADWVQINAPPDFFYEHKKEAIDIQRDGIRNFYIAGGGVDEYSEKWKELHQITDKHGWQRWEDFYNAMLRGNLPEDVKGWIIKHRSDNDVPHVDCEVRAFFIYYFGYLHSDENVGGWKSGPRDPEPESVGEIEAFVRDTYLKVLGRHADSEGERMYVQMINDGTVKREDLESVFRNSEEHKLKFGYVQDKMPFVTKDDLAEDISEFLHTTKEEARDRIEIGDKLLRESWQNANPQTPEDIENWYRTTEAYIFELAKFNQNTPDGGLSFYENLCLEPVARGMQMSEQEGRSIKVLDYGAGIGSLSYWMQRKGWEVSYLDLDSITMRFARFRAKKHELPLTFYSDKDALPENYFDLCVMVEVIEHVDDIDFHLQKVHRSLRTGGKIYATWTFPQSDEDVIDAPFHLRKYKGWGYEQMKDILMRNGFEEESTHLWIKK